MFRQPVAEVLLERVGWTVLLTLPAMALALVLGLAGGVAAGLRPRSWWGRLVTGTALVLQALPPYVLAMVAILLFVAVEAARLLEFHSIADMLQEILSLFSRILFAGQIV